MAGILDNPDGAYAKLKEMGKGLFGSAGGGLGNLGGLGGNLLGGNTQGGTAQGGNAPAGNMLGGLFGGNGSSGSGSDGNNGGGLGQSIGNMIQQGLGKVRQGQTRAIPAPDSATADAPPTTPPLPALPAQGDPAAQGGQESQPMNDVLKQLFNR
jgi:AsmA protein